MSSFNKDNFVSHHFWEIFNHKIPKKNDVPQGDYDKEKMIQLKNEFEEFFYNFPALQQLEQKTNYQFSNKHIFLEAMSHTSFIHECFSLIDESNERMEFLGDGLINFLIGQELFLRFPEKREGSYSKLRGALVNEEILASLGRFAGLDECLLLGKGEWAQFNEDKDNLVADAFEAYWAAVLLDVGSLDKLKDLFLNFIELFEKEEQVTFFDFRWLDSFDPKTRLQELVVARHRCLPKYKIERNWEEGVSETFTVTLSVGSDIAAVATHLSKKKAMHLAAQNALSKLL